VETIVATPPGSSRREEAQNEKAEVPISPVKIKTQLHLISAVIFGVFYILLLLGLLVSNLMLPERVAILFDLQGNAVGWMARNAELLMMAGTPLLLVALARLVARTTVRFPWLLPFPRRDFWLAPERRESTTTLLFGWLLFLVVMLTLDIGVLHLGIVEAHRHTPPRLDRTAMCILAFAMAAQLGIWIFGLIMQLVGLNLCTPERSAFWGAKFWETSCPSPLVTWISRLTGLQTEVPPRSRPGARAEAAQNEKPNAGEEKSQSRLTAAATNQESHFSRTAIVGACLMPLVLFALLALWFASSTAGGSGYHGEPRWQALPFWIFLPFAIAAPFCTTILGWVAASQIRRSAGKLRGLWLAVFDGLFFPLLAMAAAVFSLNYFWEVSSEPTAVRDIQMTVRALTGARAVVLWWLLVAVDWLIIHRVWRAVNAPVVSSASEPPLKPIHFWRRFAIFVVILTALFCLSKVLWMASAKRTADSQQQIRGALQIELGKKMAKLLGDERRATYSRLTFEHVPQQPAQAVVTFGNLQSWRNEHNEPQHQPRRLNGSIILDFQPPNVWTANGTGDLTGLSQVWQTATPGFPNWSDSPTAITAAAAAQKASFGPVVERVVKENVVPDYWWFDLDTGMELSLGQVHPYIDPSDLSARMAWVEKRGVDVTAQYMDGYLGLVGFGTILIPAKQPEHWDNLSAEKLTEVVSRSTLSSLQSTTATKPAFDTYYFKTREGGMGILQITGFTENPRGVKLRYKLVQAGGGNN
jgi:hypothetical protein